MSDFKFSEKEFLAVDLEKFSIGHTVFGDDGAVRDNNGNLISHAGVRRVPVPWMKPR